MRKKDTVVQVLSFFNQEMAEENIKKKPKVTPIIIEGFEVNAQNVTFQKLQEFSLTLYNKLVYQRKERNHLLLERDKLKTILENTHREIRVAEYTLKNRSKELEHMQERYRQDMNEVDQEVKYILYDHNIKLTELELWEHDLMKKTGEKNFAEELTLLKEKRQLKETLEKQENLYAEELTNITNLHIEEMSKIKNKYAEIQTENETEFKKSLSNLTEELRLKHDMEMSEVEERKNSHLAELKCINKTRFEEMKNYFNLITLENLMVISSLKQNLDAMKQNKSVMSTEVKHLKQENQKLMDPLAKSKGVVKKLTSQLINYEKDLLSLKNSRRMLKQTKEETKKIRRENNLAIKKIRHSDELHSLANLDSTCIYSLKLFTTETAHRRQKLEELLKLFLEDLKKKQQNIRELTTDPDVYQALMKMRFEYWNPQKLSYEVAIIFKAHDELLQTLEEKLDQFSIPERLGVKPLCPTYIGSVSASLVSKQ